MPWPSNRIKGGEMCRKGAPDKMGLGGFRIMRRNLIRIRAIMEHAVMSEKDRVDMLEYAEGRKW